MKCACPFLCPTTGTAAGAVVAPWQVRELSRDPQYLEESWWWPMWRIENAANSAATDYRKYYKTHSS
jgi:hypothetical protein